MGNDTLKKIDSFFRRHLLFASFICLSILIHILTLPIHAGGYIEILKESFLWFIPQIIFLSLLNSLPIFIISLILCLSISFEYTPKPSLTLRQTFYLSLISNFIFISLLGCILVSVMGGNVPIAGFLIIVAVSFVYSLGFASFITWFGNAPSYLILFKYKLDIGKYDSAAIIILLNLLVNTLMCILSWANIILHFRM